MSKLIKTDNEYKEWIGELKQRIRQSQIKAAVKVNTELLKLYWSIGGDIVRLKAEAKWGDGIIEQLSQDLKTNFPDMSAIASASTEIVIVKGNAYLFRAERLDGVFGRHLSVDCIRRAAAEHVGILSLLKLGACAAG